MNGDARTPAPVVPGRARRPGEAWLTLGRVWGITIGVHPSWLLVFALVTWSLAAGQFPAQYPGWTTTTYWAVAVVTSLLFFASIVLHELGHSRVALAHGLPIHSITLFVFGGVARIAREPSTPHVELRVAVAGPATSLLLAAVFAAVHALAGDSRLVAASSMWLSHVNLIVAVFNLLPAFPLDGGRVLRAIVWRWTGSVERATRTAAFAGHLIASALIALGIVVAVGGNVVTGIWMALIGWFLQSAASAGQGQAAVKALLGGVRVAQAMTRECPRVGREWTLERLVREEVLGKGRRCFVVADDGRFGGLLTLHEVKAVPRERWGEVAVADVLTPAEKLAVVAPTDDLASALQTMDERDVAQMPVVEDGRLVGMVGREQILHYLSARAELGV